jgi:hypothetical protein
MNIPNFLIVGAPKCGTTSLYNYLNQHPDIFLPSIKEPHYFGSDLTPAGFTGKTKKYLNLFKSVDVPHIGEASTWYLYSETAAEEIYDFNKDMKIVLMLRNPIYAAQSLHAQTLFGFNEDVKEFDKAVRLEEKRMNGESVPSNNKRLESLFYIDAYRYGRQIKRYVDLFGQSQLHIILFDDFIDRTTQKVEEVYQFLGADTSFKPNIEVKNGRKAPKSKLFHKIITKKDKKVTKFIPVKFRRKVHALLKNLNAKKKYKEEISITTKKYIYSQLIEEIKLTENILDRNLDDWKYE